MMLQRVFAGAVLIGLLTLALHDGAFHFDKETVEIKKKRYSAQRNWNLFYGQENVFNNSSIRYQADLKQLKELVKPGSVLLSDLASSYYAAAQLPVYIRNAHAHHRRSMPSAWRVLIKQRFACYLEFEENREKLAKFVAGSERFDYWLVNKDVVNVHRTKDCLIFRRHTLQQELPNFAELIWSGDYFDLYELPKN